ncbi:MAG TPA: class I SAM-dependent methyltransferase [Usitatibacter sp.]|nr:class I SAM-dependent methyltransferase [Usitatibacter sp.]
MNELPFTGERFIPGTQGEIWIEHWHRYHFARRWAAGKRVLDVACGEGYGSALLAQVAASVVGIDIAEAAIAHAKQAYAAVPNLELRCAPCTALGLPDASVDLAVSFETVEHIAEQQQFVDELARVLKPGGVLLLSCPNKLEYTDKRAYVNEFHVKELYRAELGQLIGSRFPHVEWFAQRPSFFSLIAPEQPQGAQGEVVETEEADPSRAESTIANALYFIVAASRDRAALAAVPPAVSVFSDRGDWVHHDYVKVMGMLERSAASGQELAAQVARQQAEMAELSGQLRAAHAAHLKAEQSVVLGHATVAALQAEVAAREAALGAKQREVDARGGWRWWFKLPLVRLGLLK